MQSSKLLRGLLARFSLGIVLTAVGIVGWCGQLGGQAVFAQRVVPGQSTTVGGFPACDCTQAQQQCGCKVANLN